MKKPTPVSATSTSSVGQSTATSSPTTSLQQNASNLQEPSSKLATKVPSNENLSKKNIQSTPMAGASTHSEPQAVVKAAPSNENLTSVQPKRGIPPPTTAIVIFQIKLNFFFNT